MNRISQADYFAAYAGHQAITALHRADAEVLLGAVNALLGLAVESGLVDLDINPPTGCLVAGEKNGGWRPPECPLGAPRSAHKLAQAVDIYDPDGDLDNWCMQNHHHLVHAGLYLEHPSATRGWCHLTTRAPKSGQRVFYP